MTSSPLWRTEYVSLDGAWIACPGLRGSRREPTVVAFHSSAGAGRQWRKFGERLAPRFNVVAPDFHGCGSSDPWPGLRPFRLRDEAALVPLLAARDGGSPVHLVGHSWGGAVA